MLKFRFPTKRNNENQQNQEQNLKQDEILKPEDQQNNQMNNHHYQQIENMTPIEINSTKTSPSSHSLVQNNSKFNFTPTINHPNLIQSSESIDRNPSEDSSLPINLTPTHNEIPTPLNNPLNSRKTRRKSYGGLRAMLGINRQEDHPPPLPIPPSSACSTNSQHQQHQQRHLQQHHRHNPSLDASCPSSSSSTSNFPPPPSPVFLINSPADPPPRPTSSSLRPFPFLGGIRRKSANSNANKSTNPITPLANSHPPTPSPTHPSSIHNDRAPSPSTTIPTPVTVKNKTKTLKINTGDRSTGFYSNGSSKKAQSVDDLSQFGFLPKQRILPRRSEELFELRPAGGGKFSAPPCTSTSSPASTDRAAERSDHPSDLHNGLDQIGELAGSLAGIRGSSKSDDRQPRLSNPKGMRTVYGVPIEDLYWRDGEAFPLLVDVLVNLIELKGLDQQGIYRVPGEKRVIESLQASIDEKGVHGVDIWKDCYKDVHNLSGALKLFLREIPGGVIPFDRYDRFLAVNAIADDSERTSQLQAHVKDLPIPNKILLLKLVKHFERVVAHAEANSMLAHNVAIVFAPSLFRNGSEHSNPLLSMQNIGKASAIVRHFVLNAPNIFQETSEELMKRATDPTIKPQSDTNQFEQPIPAKRESYHPKLAHQRRDSHETTQSQSKKKEEEYHKRGSMSSIQTNDTAEDGKKAKRVSMSTNRKKQSATYSVPPTFTTVSKRNQSSHENNHNNKINNDNNKNNNNTNHSNNHNNASRRNSKAGKARHSFTSSILNSSINNGQLSHNNLIPQRLVPSNPTDNSTNLTPRPQTGTSDPSPVCSNNNKKAK